MFLLKKPEEMINFTNNVSLYCLKMMGVKQDITFNTLFNVFLNSTLVLWDS